MDEDRDQMAERVLNLTLEIVYLITGENYIVVKMVTDEDEAYSRDKVPFKKPLPQSPIPERNRNQKILNITKKITELLTGEVPIRDQDVTVHLSVEEWEYLEEHKDQYKDVMVKNYQAPTSLDESSKEEAPERHPSPRYFKDYAKENWNIPLDHEQIINPTEIKVEDLSEETHAGVTELITVEGIPTSIHIDESSKEEVQERCPSPLYFKDYPKENWNMSPDHQVITEIKVEDLSEETYAGVTELITVEGIPTSIHTAGERTKNVEHVILSPEYEDKFNNTEENHREQSTTLLISNILFNPHSRDLSTARNNHMEPSSVQSQIARISPENKEGKTYPCSECGKHFKKKFNLSIHERTHRGEKPFSCSQCGKSFARKSCLTRHLRAHTGEKPYSCPICGKCFRQRSAAIYHQVVHTGEKPFSCLKCGKCFTTKSYLVEHFITHTREKPFPCSECGKVFMRKSSLIEHQRIHTGEKAYSCSECEERFNLRSEFVKHQVIHTGKKLFLCSECGKSFSKNSDRIKHQRNHSGEKPFSCLECGKCYSDRSDLSKHQRTHTVEKPYLCTECGKSFSKNSDLLKHKVIHTGEKPFSCTECGKCYHHRRTLAQHKKRSHFNVQTVANVLP